MKSKLGHRHLFDRAKFKYPAAKKNNLIDNYLTCIDIIVFFVSLLC